MIEQDEEYPGYGFKGHKGYATKEHKEAIAKLGPISLHRPTFAGVKEHIEIFLPQLCTAIKTIPWIVTFATRRFLSIKSAKELVYLLSGCIKHSFITEIIAYSLCS